MQLSLGKSINFHLSYLDMVLKGSCLNILPKAMDGRYKDSKALMCACIKAVDSVDKLPKLFPSTRIPIHFTDISGHIKDDFDKLVSNAREIYDRLNSPKHFIQSLIQKPNSHKKEILKKVYRPALKIIKDVHLEGPDAEALRSEIVAGLKAITKDYINGKLISKEII